MSDTGHGAVRPPTWEEVEKLHEELDRRITALEIKRGIKEAPDEA